MSGPRADPKNSKLGQVQICQENPGVRGRSGRIIELISYARQLLEGDHPQTLRQLHYAIFSRQVIPYENTQSDYKRLSRATTMARREYRDWELGRFTSAQAMEAIFRSSDGIVPEPPNGIPPQWMVDETRNPEIVSVWEDPVDYIEAVKDSYRRDNWQDQPRYCEVWSEKATIMGAIRRVADELGITLRVCHGYGSTGMESQIGSLFTTIRKPVTVFYWATMIQADTVSSRTCTRACSGPAESVSKCAVWRYMQPTSEPSIFRRKRSRVLIAALHPSAGSSGREPLRSNWTRCPRTNCAAGSLKL
jgi:hypothetical protein